MKIPDGLREFGPTLLLCPDCGANEPGSLSRRLIEQARVDALTKHSPSSTLDKSHDGDDIACLPILIEEIGEVATAVADANETQLAAELAQVAAVALMWLEGMVMRGDA